jgi:hypothetical protein
MPRSITDNLRLNHKHLLEMHDAFMEISGEVRTWTFYETLGSQLSGLGASIYDEVHFNAPLSSIKSSLVRSRHEMAFALESDHAHCASFGDHNIPTLHSYLADLGKKLQWATELGQNEHHAMKLPEVVKVELYGFYDDPEPESNSDVRLYSSKPFLSEFLEKGPERCLDERLNQFAPNLHRAPGMKPQRPPSASSGVKAQGSGTAHGFWNNVQSIGQRIVRSASPSPSRIPEQTETVAQSPEIVVTSHQPQPSIGSNDDPTGSRPTVASRRGRTLTVPTISTRAASHSASRSSHRRTESDGSTKSRPDLAGTGLGRRSYESAPPEPVTSHHVVESDDDEESPSSSEVRKERAREASAKAGFMAGFSRPDPARRKFIWIHLSFTNPHWVKVGTSWKQLPSTVSDYKMRLIGT